jgi:Bacterial Ig-like domain
MRTVALWLMLVVGCYDRPQPACGFRCGTGGACPASYTCATDGYCHAEGTTQTCPVVDGGLEPVDRAPSLQQIIPAHDALEVSVETRIVATFTEPVLAVSAATFTLVPFEDSENPVAAQVTYDPVTRTARLIPDVQLRWSTRYVATLADAITDTRGQALDGARSWSFTTERDSEGPRLLSIDPLPGTTSVSVSPVLVLTFSEPVHFPFGAVVLASNGNSVGISPNAFALSTLVFEPTNLAPYTLHTLTLTAFVVDLVGNPLQNAPVSTTFTTGADLIAPTVVFVNPSDGQDFVGVTIKPTVRFSEPVTNTSATSITLTTARRRSPRR